MDIYLVIFEKVSSYKYHVASFTEREEAVKCVADIASSGKYQDSDYYLSDVNLKKIILFD